MYATVENIASILTYSAGIIGATFGLWAILFLMFSI